MRQKKRISRQRPYLAGWPGLFGWMVAALSLAWLVGCMPDKVQALEQYSATCKQELTPRLERYVASFQKSGRYDSRQSLQQTMKKQILPTLSSYVTALQQLRPTTPRLEQIHRGLTNAYTQWLGTLEAFTKGLDSDAGWVKSAAGLRHQAQALERAEEQYQTQLKQYARSPKRRR